MILEPVSDDDPRTPYFIEVCDALWNPIGRLSAAWDDLAMRHIACDVGPGKVDCAGTDDNRKLLAAGATVRVWQGTTVKQSGMYRIAGETTDEAGNSTINLTWNDALEYLADALADPNPGSLGDLGTKVFDQRGGFVSTAILGYVRANVGAGARPELRAPGLVLGADPLGGVWLETPAAARFDKLLEFLANLALPNGCVFTVDTDDRAQVFNVRQVEDLSRDVVFSAQSFNLGAGNWSRTAPKATRITVLGPGEPQLIFEVTTPESLRQEQSWGRVFRDVLSSSTLVEADPGLYLTEWLASRDLGNQAVTWKRVAADAVTAADASLKAWTTAIGDFNTADQDAKNAKNAWLKASVDATRAIEVWHRAVDTADPNAAALQTAMDAAMTEEQRQSVTAVNAQNTADTKRADTAAKAATANADSNFKAYSATQAVESQALADDAALNLANAFNAATVAATRASLTAEAERKLSELGETWSAQYTVLDSGPFLFGRDYFLGDIIGVHPAGLDEPLAFPVREFTESVSVSSGRRIQPVIGDYGSTSGLQSGFTTKQLLQTVDRLQTRR